MAKEQLIGFEEELREELWAFMVTSAEEMCEQVGDLDPVEPNRVLAHIDTMISDDGTIAIMDKSHKLHLFRMKLERL